MAERALLWLTNSLVFMMGVSLFCQLAFAEPNLSNLNETEPPHEQAAMDLEKQADELLKARSNPVIKSYQAAEELYKQASTEYQLARSFYASSKPVETSELKRLQQKSTDMQVKAQRCRAQIVRHRVEGLL